jgi:hypothetical protein
LFVLVENDIYFDKTVVRRFHRLSKIKQGVAKKAENLWVEESVIDSLQKICVNLSNLRHQPPFSELAK